MWKKGRTRGLLEAMLPHSPCFCCMHNGKKICTDALGDHLIYIYIYNIYTTQHGVSKVLGFWVWSLGATHGRSPFFVGERELSIFSRAYIPSFFFGPTPTGEIYIEGRKNGPDVCAHVCGSLLYPCVCSHNSHNSGGGPSDMRRGLR